MMIIDPRHLTVSHNKRFNQDFDFLINTSMLTYMNFNLDLLIYYDVLRYLETRLSSNSK